MRKSALLVVMLCLATALFTTGCKSEKANSNADSTDSASLDTLDTTHVDTVAKLVEETPMPKSADQLFDDFFFNFVANRKLQRSRIMFPLAIYTGSKVTHINRSQWKMDRFFMPQEYYTLIFDNEKQTELAKSTDLDTVVVEKIHLKKGSIKQYCFDHQEGKWRLNAIRNIGFSKSVNASFLKFLPKFFARGGRGMVQNPLPYSGPDPNGEETSMVNTKIPADEWSTFLPEIPGEMIYNILYGQHYGESNKKILVFKGLSNGLETQLVFKRRGNSWKLTQLDTF